MLRKFVLFVYFVENFSVFGHFCKEDKVAFCVLVLTFSATLCLFSFCLFCVGFVVFISGSLCSF